MSVVSILNTFITSSHLNILVLLWGVTSGTNWCYGYEAM